MVDFLSGKRVSENIDSLCRKDPRLQTGDSGSLTSPNFPNRYDDDLDCKWLIVPPENKLVEINFESQFDLEPKSYGCYDWLKIHSSTGEMEHCGLEAPGGSVHFGLVRISFHTDGATTRTGFKLNWRIKPDSCGKRAGLQTGESGIITSPGYPENYKNNINCKWSIVPPENTLVEMSFDPKFDLQSKSDGGCYDSLIISSDTGRMEYCGEYAPVRSVHAGNLSIAFKTDYSTTKSGFVLFWKLIKVDSTCNKNPRILNGRSGSIVSPNYPENYDNGLDCKWLISPPENTTVVIAVDPIFYLQPKTDGCSDALTVNSETDYKEYCGANPPERQNHTGNVTIGFKTDGSTSYFGFRLDWTIVKFWRVVVYTDGVGTMNAARVGFSGAMSYHLGTGRKAGSNEYRELQLPVNVNPPEQRRVNIIAEGAGWYTKWRVIQVAIMSLTEDLVIIYSCGETRASIDRLICYRVNVILRPVKWRVAVYSGNSRANDDVTSRNFYGSGIVYVEIIGEFGNEFAYLGTQFGSHSERKDAIVYTSRNITGKPKTVKLWTSSRNQQPWIIKRFEMTSNEQYPNERFVAAANNIPVTTNSTAPFELKHLGRYNLTVIELNMTSIVIFPDVRGGSVLSISVGCGAGLLLLIVVVVLVVVFTIRRRNRAAQTPAATDDEYVTVERTTRRRRKTSDPPIYDNNEMTNVARNAPDFRDVDEEYEEL
ncbi:cubilin-like isoform X2 [Tubulanus polymorphus]|uniref:cubilin-like isoform X2 n=1 Tax=Tubulanus polymorphus TaxID=672921 RepID=UPI003DA6C2DD